MFETTVQVKGMMCTMCEAHINDVVRSKFSVKKVTSSHSKGKTVILSQQPLDHEALAAAITATGYEVGDITARPQEKKGLLGFFGK